MPRAAVLAALPQVAARGGEFAASSDAGNDGLLAVQEEAPCGRIKAASSAAGRTAEDDERPGLASLRSAERSPCARPSAE